MKGKVDFHILYVTADGAVSRIDGQLPFEEQVYMDGVQNGDNVEIRSKLEDLSIDMVNSRKLSMRALLSLDLCVEELYDEEMAVELYHEEPIETKKHLLTIAEIAIQKKDILRFKEEIEMPQSFPNIFEIIWEEVRISGMNFEAQQEQITAQGEIQVFLLYEGEGEDRPLKCFEKTIPFKETIECQGSSELMIPDISWQISHSEIEVRADFDGEERVACLDLVLDLDIKLYEEEQIEALSDVPSAAAHFREDKSDRAGETSGRYPGHCRNLPQQRGGCDRDYGIDAGGRGTGGNADGRSIVSGR